MATRLPDDSIATARDLGFLDSFRKIRGSLGVKGGTFDLDDYYESITFVLEGEWHRQDGSKVDVARRVVKALPKQ